MNSHRSSHTLSINPNPNPNPHSNSNLFPLRPHAIVTQNRALTLLCFSLFFFCRLFVQAINNIHIFPLYFCLTFIRRLLSTVSPKLPSHTRISSKAPVYRLSCGPLSSLETP